MPLLPLLPVEFCGTPSSSRGGSFSVETCPLLRPTAINGSEGWTAWVNSSPDSGSEQIFSNIAAQLGAVQSARLVVGGSAQKVSAIEEFPKLHGRLSIGFSSSGQQQQAAAAHSSWGSSVGPAFEVTLTRPIAVIGDVIHMCFTKVRSAVCSSSHFHYIVPTWHPVLATDIQHPNGHQTSQTERHLLWMYVAVLDCDFVNSRWNCRTNDLIHSRL